jgi:hypothetical protein
MRPAIYTAWATSTKTDVNELDLVLHRRWLWENILWPIVVCALLPLLLWAYKDANPRSSLPWTIVYIAMSIGFPLALAIPLFAYNYCKAWILMPLNRDCNQLMTLIGLERKDLEERDTGALNQRADQELCHLHDMGLLKDLKRSSDTCKRLGLKGWDV